MGWNKKVGVFYCHADVSQLPVIKLTGQAKTIGINKCVVLGHAITYLLSSCLVQEDWFKVIFYCKLIHYVYILVNEQNSIENTAARYK